MNRIESYSPLRVSFSGGGTDISPFLENYGSKVFNTTIDHGVHIIYSRDNLPLEVSSRDFLRTVVLGEGHGKSFQGKIIDLLTSYGIDKGRLYINGEVPPGSGLASSSAMITALMRIILELRNEYEDPYQLAKLSYKAEKELFGITLGIQDPYAISIGGFKYMKSDGKNVEIKKYSNNKFLNTLGEGLLICYTGGTRESSEVLRTQVKSSMENNKDTINHLSKLKDITESVVSAVENEDYQDFCNQINYGWAEKRLLSQSVSSPIVDKIILDALENGADAGRLLGGGNQGFVLVICKPERLWNVQKRLMNLSDFVIRITPTFDGTRLNSSPLRL
jgi:D-glycero-alpha-D-manno-heptose-7-phosphate kinase